MVRVMAQGVFDILHPGHLHYFSESTKLGDELHVVVSNDVRVRERKDILMDHDSRREMVEGLKMIDEAHVGVEDDIYAILDVVEPDIITIGYDQPWDPEATQQDLADNGYEGIEVVRIGEYEPDVDDVVSSTDIKERIKERAPDRYSFFHRLDEA